MNDQIPPQGAIQLFPSTVESEGQPCKRPFVSINGVPPFHKQAVWPWSVADNIPVGYGEVISMNTEYWNEKHSL